jgi:hypothetical protein
MGKLVDETLGKLLWALNMTSLRNNFVDVVFIPKKKILFCLAAFCDDLINISGDYWQKR